jgi:hypothetical protein
MECYVYLADLTSISELLASRWFTRGWTLQELIAPESALFFNKHWQEIGTKGEPCHGDISHYQYSHSSPSRPEKLGI